MDFPTYEENNPFLYEHSGLTTKLVSLIFFICTLGYFIGYTANNFHTAIETLTLSGNRISLKSDQSYIIATVPRIKDNQVFSVFFLDLTTSSKDALFDIDTDVSCHNSSKNSKRVYFQTNSTDCTEGSYRFFSTDYFKYDFFTVQIWITGNISLIKDAQIRILQSYPEFGENEFKFRLAFSFCCFCCLIGFIVSILIFTKKNTKFEQYISLVVLIIATLSNFPLSFTKKTESYFAFHSIENLLRGAFPAFNLVALYCITYLFTGGENVYIILTLSVLFVVSEAMSEFTDDCCVIGRLFFGNYVVWIFFVSASIVSKISLSLLLTWNVASYLFFKSARQKAKNSNQCSIFVVYIILFLVQIISMAFQAVIFVNQGCGNNTFDFFHQYMIQTLFALVLANVHWPVFLPKSEKLGLNSLEFESEEIRLDVDSLYNEVGGEVKSADYSDRA